MFTTFVRNIISYNAPNTFERARVLVTYAGDTDPPLEKDLKNVLLSFAGKNPEVRGSEAFYIIIAKLQASKSRKNWNYIVKNLVILDRAIDEKCFAKEISELELPDLEKDREDNKKVSLFIRRYFRYIKAKGRIFNTKYLPFNLPFEKRREVLDTLDGQKLLVESKRIKSLVILALDVFETGSKDTLGFNLNKYVFLLTLNTLLGALSTQYIIFVIILENLLKFDKTFVIDFYWTFKEFLFDIQKLISYSKALKFIPGFQLPSDTVCDPKVCSRVLTSIEEYIKFLEEDTPNRSSRLHAQSIAISKYNLAPKSSQIDLASFVEALLVQPKGDNPNIEFDLGDSECDSAGLEPQNYLTPAKRVISFHRESMLSPNIDGLNRDTFLNGLPNYLSVDIDEGPQPRILVHDGDISAKKKNFSNYFTESNKKTKKAVRNECEVSLFTQLLCLEEKDDIFDNYDNFYSDGYKNNFKAQYNYSAVKECDRLRNRLGTIGRLPIDMDISGFCEDVEAFDDFDEDLFANYKNTYIHG